MRCRRRVRVDATEGVLTRHGIARRGSSSESGTSSRSNRCLQQFVDFRGFDRPCGCRPRFLDAEGFGVLPGVAIIWATRSQLQSSHSQARTAEYPATFGFVAWPISVARVATGIVTDLGVALMCDKDRFRHPLRDSRTTVFEQTTEGIMMT